MSNNIKPKIKKLALDDLPTVANIHKISFPNSLLTHLGRETIIRYYKWQFDSGANVYPIGLFFGGKLIGYCFGGSFRAALGGFLGQNKIFHAFQILRNPKIFLKKRFIQSIFESLKLTIKFSSKKNIELIDYNQKKYFGILAIAIDPDYSNNGYGKHLISDSENFARKNKYSFMRLTADINSINTIKFYESIGMQRVIENGSWQGKMYKKL